MLKRIHQLLHHDDEPPNRVEKTLATIDAAIAEIDKQLTTVDYTVKIHIAKIDHLSSRQQELKKQAKVAFQQEKHNQAKNLWNNARLIDQQQSKYQTLFDSICDTQETLANKKSELEYKRDQLRAQISLGEINANSTQIHADIMEHIMLLNNSNELSLFDDRIAQANSKIEALQEMDATLVEMESASFAEDGMTLLAEEIKQDQQHNLQTHLDKVKVQYKDFFTITNTTNDNHISKKQQTLNAFLAGEEKSKNSIINDFFETESPKNGNTEHEDRIKNFFGA